MYDITRTNEVSRKASKMFNRQTDASLVSSGITSVEGKAFEWYFLAGPVNLN